ncbi:Cro/CI family transcriptional regulator [Kushneria phosphatilytica]|uniref:Uncharacterized protein n=1 Tax=Kushneria phosphatilytica TaxID=657387 RepID=A0A1S1P0L7_9GAMM|nr:Cro/CI family transcriptional regulator [Kushneria phosphatilytica]OHV12978.1 hypothetical protein BH688_02965 [Kushneria phosphatilytica]QEL10848.1 hypothetical protein FY550_06730 [Kushneria phosphatilytica]
MTKQDVIDHYGSVTETARALGRSKGAVSQWPPILPINLQYEIEGRTSGKLRADVMNDTAPEAVAQRG